MTDTIEPQPATTPVVQLVNPYKGIEKNNPQDCHRISLDVSKEDVFLIRSAIPALGDLYSALTMYVKHLAEYVKHHELSYSIESRQHLVEHIIGTCDICAIEDDSTNPTRPTPSGPSLVESKGHDGRTTERLHQIDSSTSNKSTTEPREQTPQTIESAITGVVKHGRRSRKS